MAVSARIGRSAGPVSGTPWSTPLRNSDVGWSDPLREADPDARRGCVVEELEEQRFVGESGRGAQARARIFDAQHDQAVLDDERDLQREGEGGCPGLGAGACVDGGAEQVVGARLSGQTHSGVQAHEHPAPADAAFPSGESCAAFHQSADRQAFATARVRNPADEQHGCACSECQPPCQQVPRLRDLELDSGVQRIGQVGDDGEGGGAEHGGFHGAERCLAHENCSSIWVTFLRIYSDGEPAHSAIRLASSFPARASPERWRSTWTAGGV